ncbi:cytochrome P450 [Streptomyces sp. RY43-2]|uniref:Cytochrome P450 n=1 Tax=Streptomyces macrolidinus TaxID=2952607 RepID=A0ABT0ZLD4_9ACTN|nr:cytochrome P450 [Streptomyces macrolidinus]MCN9244365.1 cytochrome P450 [Streptomyces macrolidinus]
MPAPVLDLAALGDRFTLDPYPTYARMRSQGPVHKVHTPDGEDVWLVVGHEQARAVLTDPRFSKDWVNSSTMLNDAEAEVAGNMLESDPPRHTRLRKLVAREFTARRIERMRPRIQQIVDDLLDAMSLSPDGRADLIEALAWPLPITVICELLGVPEQDRSAFRGWTDTLVFPEGADDRDRALTGMTEYLTGLIADKRRQPDDDLLSALVRTSEEDGSKLSSEELVGMAFILLIAGHETTVNLIGNGVHALLTHPDQLGALRSDMTLLEGAVEEMLRYEGPVETATYRFPTEPVDLGGTVVPAGDSVLVVLADADRCPARFPEPSRFDVRRDARGHLAFGYGLHHCAGAPLARLEAQIAVGSLLERFPDLGLGADPDALVWYPNMMIRGLKALPVQWSTARAAAQEPAV